MSRLDENEILRCAARLAAIKPSPEATSRAVERALATVEVTPARRHFLWLAPLGLVAAAVALAFGLRWYDPLRPHTPEQQLAATLAACEEYRGSVRASLDHPVEAMISPGLRGKVEEEEAVAIESVYVDSVQGTEAVVASTEGVALIVTRWSAVDLCEVYDARANTITVDRTDPTARELFRPPTGQPLRLSEVVRRCQEILLRYPHRIDAKQDEESLRLDIEVTGEAEAYAVAASTQPAQIELGRLTLWVDPESYLLQRAVIDAGGATRGITFSYSRQLRNIYALGAPMGARVIDRCQPVWSAYAYND